MALFKSNKEGGFMDVIRCDQQEYLVWKWSPSGNPNISTKENAIRYGSSLRVKEGEVAIFVYKQENGTLMDYIEGPYDQTIKTANFPILASLVGMAFGGNSPFQAEIYFINLSGNIQINFGIPYFDVFDPRFDDFSVPVSARGTITFNLTNYKEFIKLNRLITFDLDQLKKQIKDALIKNCKTIITNIPAEKNIPVIQLERKILEINETIYPLIEKRFKTDFGINLKSFDLSTIEFDKESNGYTELRKITAQQTTLLTEAQTEINIKQLKDAQEIQAKNFEENLRIQREEGQRIQKLKTETEFVNTHSLNQQTEILKAGAESLGSNGSGSLGGGDGLNPAGLVTSMMLGGAIGNQMSGMMNQFNQQNQLNQHTQTSQSNNQQTPPPPPISTIVFHAIIEGASTGPISFEQINDLIKQNIINQKTLIWKAGLTDWTEAVKINELQNVFINTPPPPPITI